MDFAAIPWRATNHVGIGIHFYASDRRSGRIVCLIRMEPGCGYPRHRHLGAEDVLVVQGGYRDERGEYKAGRFVHYDEESEHSPVAITEPGGVPCILLAVAHEGVLRLDE